MREKNTKLSLSCTAFLFLCMLACVVGVASARTIYVPDDYAKIQWAVDAASAGDTIIVRPGTYKENVVVNKSLEIRSYSQNPSDTVVKAYNSNDHVFNVTADNVIIKGFTVTGATGFWNAGVYLLNSKNSRIENVNASNNYDGISLESSSNNTITNNTASNNGDGISLESSSNNTITNNTASNNYWAGISLWFSSNNIIYLNNFINNTHQVYSYGSKNIWNSTEKITYTYNGKQHTNYLGNYWSDYTGNDSDGDGIGDTPYSIDGDKDNYPLMERFEYYIGITPVPNQPPIANFTYYPEKPVVNQSVTFDASSSYDPDGKIMNYEWDFGDGNIMITTEEKINHSYSEAGSYEVTLTVTDDEGAKNSTTKMITVMPAPPSVSISTDKYEYTAGDVMLINITIKNPSERKSVKFLWTLEILDYDKHFTIIDNRSLLLPALYDKTFTLRWKLPELKSSFNASWHVAIFNKTTSELISEDHADWKYVATKAKKSEDVEGLEKSVREMEMPF